MFRLFLLILISFFTSCTTDENPISIVSIDDINSEKQLSEYSDEEICNKAVAPTKSNPNTIDWNLLNKIYVEEAKLRGESCGITLPGVQEKLSTTENPNAEPLRVALLIGNSNYETYKEEFQKFDKLNNPLNDVKLLKDTLEDFDFEVMLEVDLDDNEFRETLDNFLIKLKNNDHEAILFYYAGHALQHNGINYLAPINSKIKIEKDIDKEMISANEFVSDMADHSENSLKIVLLDACRVKSKFSKSSNYGLAPMDFKNSIIQYSTSDNGLAKDGEGSNSPYLEKLVENIKSSNDNIIDILNDTMSDVDDFTIGEQVPYIHYSSTQEFYFQNN